MNKAPINVQDQFLNQVRREKIAVTVDLASGKTVKGTIRSFDNFCVIIEGQGQQLIYKHAISSIYPTERTVRLGAFNEGHGGHAMDRRPMDRRVSYGGGHAGTDSGHSAGGTHDAAPAEGNGPGRKP